MKTAAEVRAYKRDWARRKRGYVTPVERPCVICNGMFMAPVWQPRSQTCSRPCSKKLEYRTHRSKYCARATAAAKANPERTKVYQRRSHERNKPLYQAIWRLKQQRRNARMAGAPGAGITKAEWLEIQTQQNGRCWWCAALKPLTIDHITPIVKGGAHCKSNIVGACHSCNSKKRDRIWPLESGKLCSDHGIEAVWAEVEKSYQ